MTQPPPFSGVDDKARADDQWIMNFGHAEEWLQFFRQLAARGKPAILQE
ncbi:hypothetical protein [Methylomonas albis]|nr:hypothetical protein [Methylomonas albis]